MFRLFFLCKTNRHINETTHTINETNFPDEGKTTKAQLSMKSKKKINMEDVCGVGNNATTLTEPQKVRFFLMDQPNQNSTKGLLEKDMLILSIESSELLKTH